MLSPFWAFARRLSTTTPWTQNVGLARTLVMLSGLGTLLFSSVDTLIRPAAGLSYPHCAGPAQIATWCLGSPPLFEIVRWFSVAVLAIAASGWRPRITAIPAWWVLFSTQAAATTVDGGDQIAANLALILIPLSLTDDRRWHWEVRSKQAGVAVTLFAHVAVFAGAAQMSFVYLNAGLSKLSVPEWNDGTALYYWMNDPMFGPSEPLRSLISGALMSPLLLAAATWGPMILEFALGLALVLPSATRKPLLGLGVAFHCAIAVCMGLWSFAFVMTGGLLLLLVPRGHAFTTFVSKWTRKRSTPALKDKVMTGEAKANIK